MCDKLSDRALRLRRLALDFRLLAQKPGLDALAARQLLASAAQLELLADSECQRQAPSIALDDVVWAEAATREDDGVDSPDAPAPVTE